MMKVTMSYILTSPLACRPVIEFVGTPVVIEQILLGHVVLVGRVHQCRGGHRAHRGRCKCAKNELRPALGVAYVNGADQDPGNGADQTGDARGGRARLLGLYPRRHGQSCCRYTRGEYHVKTRRQKTTGCGRSSS